MYLFIYSDGEHIKVKSEMVHFNKVCFIKYLEFEMLRV